MHKLILAMSFVATNTFVKSMDLEEFLIFNEILEFVMEEIKKVELTDDFDITKLYEAAVQRMLSDED